MGTAATIKFVNGNSVARIGCYHDGHPETVKARLEDFFLTGPGAQLLADEQPVGHISAAFIRFEDEESEQRLKSMKLIPRSESDWVRLPSETAAREFSWAHYRYAVYLDRLRGTIPGLPAIPEVVGTDDLI